MNTMTQPKAFTKTGTNCPRCGAPEIWAKNHKTKELFKSCINWARGCKPGSVTPSTTPNATTTPVKSLEETITEAALTRLKPELALQIKAELADEFAQAIENAVAELSEYSNKPKVIEWKINDISFAKVEGKCHVAINQLMRRAKAGLKNYFISGPSGSGKSHLAEDFARALKLPFASISMSMGMSEHHLIGRSLPNLTTGKSVYEESDFVRLYSGGGIYLADEFDSADPNVLIVINSALANDRISIPARAENPVAFRHKDFYFIAAGNTFGQGSDRMYVGRSQIDAATLDRFSACVLYINYDHELETTLVPEETIREAIWEMREKAERNKIRRIIGMRALLAVAALVRSGETLKDSLDALCIGWSSDEISKVMPTP
jgi:cobaltochelatase CobS